MTAATTPPMPQASIRQHPFVRTPRRRALAGAALLACSGLAGLAQAAHVPSSPYVFASGSSSAGDGVVNNGAAWVDFFNGAISGTPAAGGGGAYTASWDAGPMAPGATTLWASTLASAAGGGASTLASASLERGELKVSAVVDKPIGNAFVGATGIASARFQENVWFTNTTSGYLAIVLSMGVDGSNIGDFVRAEMFSFIGLSAGGGGGCNADALCIVADPARIGQPYLGYSVALYGDINQQAAAGNKLNFRNQLSGQVNDDIPWWSFSYGAGHGPDAGLYDYTKSITLYVPPGETTLGIDAWFRLTVCSAAGGPAMCDFGQTSAIRFGALPDGLSFGSSSGVFLAEIPPIPEPATWVMWLGGLGVLGWLARRRG
jgi:hypothetical protein